MHVKGFRRGTSAVSVAPCGASGSDKNPDVRVFKALDLDGDFLRFPGAIRLETLHLDGKYGEQNWGKK
ncbi:MAG: hypothetical protein Q4A92_00945 [Corynebacterium sp.]|nr:hypothetical protein [Corynebacterium sp.]